MPEEIVIVGDGIAGATAAVTARKLSPEASITILTDEPATLYNRVALKDYCKGDKTEAQLFIHDLGFYEKQNIHFVPNTRVIELRDREHRLVTQDGSIHSYTKLVLATGGTPRRMGIANDSAEGIHTFWTLAESRKLLEHAKEAENGVVIGAGLLGIDLAVIFGVHQVATKYVMRGDRWWRQGLTREGSEIVEKGLAAIGVECVFHDNVSEFEAHDGRVSGAKLETGGTVPCDIGGIAIGLRYNHAFLRGSRVKIGEGILTDEHMRTSVPDVYACGDVAQYYDILLDRIAQNGSWASAKRQGEVVGTNLTGKKEMFRLVDTYSINHFDFMIMSVGTVEAERAIHERYDGDNYRQVFFKGNRCVGAVFVGDVSQAGILRRVIDKEIDLKDREAELLKWEIPKEIVA